MTSLPDFSNITISQLDDLSNKYMKMLLELNDKLATLPSDQLRWNTFIQPQLDFYDDNAVKMAIFDMSAFHTSAEIREKCNECETKLTQFYTEQGMRKDVFEKFNEYYHGFYQTEKNDLTAEQNRYVEKELLAYKMLGLDLPNEKYEKVKEIKKELVKLANDFSLNINNYNKTFELKPEQLVGMPEKWLGDRKNENGNYNVTLKYPDYIPLMEYCKNRETREMIFKAFNNRAKDSNLPIVNKLFLLKQEMAKLFGFDKYSDYKLQDRMAKSTSNVVDFLASLSKKTDEVYNNDIKVLTEMASVDGITDVQTYDIPYYSRIHTEKESELNKEELKKYFPLDKVTAGMFEIYQNLLGFVFTDVSNDHKHTFWHDDVRLYRVNNKEDNKLMGYFYLDLFPREGKYGHAAVFTFVRKSAKNVAIVAMACNFPKTDNLSHDFVTTYFHEFGHVMHSMASEATISTLSGTSCERDFVETPSQQLEEWCVSYEPLKLMSDGITLDVVNKLKKQEKLLQGIFIKRQLSFGIFDMLMHSADVKDPVLTYSEVYNELTGMKFPDDTCFPATFGHIISGYEAGYYGYLWSKVYAVDMFESMFKGHELDPVVGMSFRKSILAHGGMRDSLISVSEFLGRQPSDEAFIKRLLST